MGDIVEAILTVLSIKGEISIDDIARELDVKKDKVINAINTLKGLGLIDVKRSNDGVIRLSSDARKLLGLA
jgi:Mn-dependent DtxR family transcriptional regulator